VNSLDSMVNLLVSDEPRRSADRILTRLVQIHQARGGAILRPRQGQVEIWMSVGLSLPAVSALPVRWADHAAELAAGRSVIESGFGLFPAMSGHEMVAALYLAQPEGLSALDAAVFGTAIAHAVLASDTEEPRAPVQAASPAEQGRLQMLTLLDGNDWNIAEVARRLGVTRRTVYMRLRSFGIERRRVPKLYKKMPVGG
jgi:ActR/RegA family two-component response regulator